MPEKTTPAGRRYEVDGRKFTWFPLDDDDNAGEAFTLPLRIKLKVIRGLAGTNLSADDMFVILERLLDGDESKIARLDEMDTNDFQTMFATWQTEYNLVTGATPGESSSSSS